MTTDDDILRVLNGEPDAEQQRNHNAILEALGQEPRPVPGLVPLARRGDDFEEVSIWAAKEAASRAIKELSEAIMRDHPSKGIYTAEHEAKEIAAEIYEHAGKGTPYEDERLRAVERVVGKWAARSNASAAAPPKASPVKAVESTTITSRRREQIRETDGGGRITNL